MLALKPAMRQQYFVKTLRIARFEPLSAAHEDNFDLCEACSAPSQNGGGHSMVRYQIG